MARRGRSGALDMNFDGLADSVTNLVGALILLVVLIIGVTKDAVSQVETTAEKPEFKSDSGQQSILPLQRRIALLQTQVEGVERDIQSAERRLEPLRQQVEELLQKVEEVQPPKNEEEPPKEKTAKEIPYRPPFERIDAARKPAVFVVEEGRVSFLDLAEVSMQVNRMLSEKPGLSSIDLDLPGGDFRVRGKMGPGEVALDVERKPNAKGETLEEARQAGSKFQQKLAALDPNSSTVDFDVYPDSYEAFSKLRELAWNAKLGVGWKPRKASEVIKLKQGPSVSVTQ